MTVPNAGVGSFIGFSAQTGYTTRVVPTTHMLPLVSGGDNFVRSEDRIETAGIDSIGYSSTRYRRGKVDAKGPITVEVMYTGTELLWKYLFGSVSTSRPSPTNAPNVYDHTFTIADAIIEEGMTIEVNRGGTSFYGTGCHIDSAEISQGLDAYMQMNMDIIARDLDTGTASTAVIPTSNAFAAPDGRIQWNSTIIDVSNWSIQFNNNLDSDRFFIGSRYRKSPNRGSRLEITGSFEIEFDSLTMWTDFKNATQRSFLIQSIGDTIEGGYYNEFNMTLPIATLTDVPINVGDEGRIIYTVSFKAFRSSSQKEVGLVLRNTTTSVS